MLPASWKPVPARDLIRVGNEHDGGYVVPRGALVGADLLISMGLNADWSFEEAFLELGGRRVVCFDHTVDTRFWTTRTVKHMLRMRGRSVPDYWRYRRFFSRETAEHRLQMVGYDHAPDSVSLTTLVESLQPNGSSVLKVDIEGWEYRILDQIVLHRDRFRAVVIEFHDVDLHRDRVSRFMESMSGFSVVWLHGNNFGGSDGQDDPIVIEVCLARLQPTGDIPAQPVASFTTPNDARQPDLDLSFEPA